MSEYQPTTFLPYDQYDICGEPIVECAPKPKHEHPVFRLVSECNAMMQDLRFRGSDEAAAYSARQTKEVHRALKKGKLLNKPVIAYGSDIEMPMTSVDVQSGTISFVAESNDSDIELEDIYRQGTAMGLLKTVSSVIEPASKDDNGMPVDWKVSLSYVITTQTDVQPRGKIELYARAPVGTTVIEYADDRRLRIVREALDQLLVIESPELVVLIDEFNSLVSKSERTTADVVRIGELVHAVYNADELGQKQRDALHDLVTNNLYDVDMHEIRATGVYNVDADSRAHYMHGNDGVVGFVGIFDDIVIMPGFERDETGDNVRRSDSFEVFFAAEANDHTYYFPLSGVTKFETAK